MNSPFPQETVDILHLLMTAVLADDVIKDEEIQALSHAAATLNLVDFDNNQLSEDVLNSWLRENYTGVQAAYMNANKDMALVSLILRLEHRPDKKQIQKAIYDVCQADGVYHTNEKVLASLISAYWT